MPQFLWGGLRGAWQQRKTIFGHKRKWNLAKNVLTTEEINMFFFFATDQWGITLWPVAAQEQILEILGELCD